jgi:WD40 repeat protein
VSAPDNALRLYDTGFSVWDTTSGQELLSFGEHTGKTGRLALSPDGRRLAIPAWPWALKIWDATTGEDLLTLGGHRSPVLCVAFSSDGHRIASGALDGVVKIWDATPLGAGGHGR